MTVHGVVEYFIIVLIWTIFPVPNRGAGLNQRMLVISFDGFRQAYFNGNHYLPWFGYFRQQGVYSDTVKSIFPSETFPNHFAIVTGMYAESHGVIGNHMFDWKLNSSFSRWNNSAAWWGRAEPIWVTAELQNKPTAVIFWPGSGVKYPPNDTTPSFYYPVYSDSMPFEKRINETVGYLLNNNVQLALIYFQQPDLDGHYYGPESSSIGDRLQKLDWYVSILLHKLDAVGLGSNELNVILCADHGMTNITVTLFLEDYIALDLLEKVPSYGTVVNIQPRETLETYVFAILRDSSRAGNPFDVYLKKDVPPELHYAKSDRVMAIVLICKMGAFMKLRRPPSRSFGAHGYDPNDMDMKPMFMARGPAFKTGGYRAANVFETKDIYAIIAHVTGIKPRETNASLDLVLDLFSPEAYYLAISKAASFDAVSSSILLPSWCLFLLQMF